MTSTACDAPPELCTTPPHAPSAGHDVACRTLRPCTSVGLPPVALLHSSAAATCSGNIVDPPPPISGHNCSGRISFLFVPRAVRAPRAHCFLDLFWFLLRSCGWTRRGMSRLSFGSQEAGLPNVFALDAPVSLSYPCWTLPTCVWGLISSQTKKKKNPDQERGWNFTSLLLGIRDRLGIDIDMKKKRNHSRWAKSSKQRATMHAEQ